MKRQQIPNFIISQMIHEFQSLYFVAVFLLVVPYALNLKNTLTVQSDKKCAKRMNVKWRNDVNCELQSHSSNLPKEKDPINAMQ